MSISERQQSLVQEFKDLPNWEERYKRIIEIGKEAEPLSDEDKIDENLVKGCQSQVWVTAELEGNKVFYAGDSDALIVRGLVALLMRLYSGATPDEILGTDPEFISALGFERQLTPSRAKGLHAMIKQIKYYALAFKAIQQRQQA
ncbi:MAG: SufE family protein [Pseudobdellovibrionaceae bacterium]|nr:MAG: SufE family protein [Pseudobdellovibrionaceae bacterium]